MVAMSNLVLWVVGFVITGLCSGEILDRFANGTAHQSTRALTAGCEDEVWCTIAMPETSFFRFDPPKDVKRWRAAQILAASGEQVLLKKVRGHFPNQFDFLDGDELFRHFNHMADIHIDHNRDLWRLAKPLKEHPFKFKKVYSWEKGPKSEVPQIQPPEYDISGIQRAPVAMIGYGAFVRTADGPYYSGKHIGDAIVEKYDIYRHWQAVKKEITKPFILMHGANENWGILSTLFPNRTVDWGEIEPQDEKQMLEILNHPQLVLFAVTQHHNVTHPKLITLPRGMPLNWERKRTVMYDNIHSFPDATRKSSLVFTASSSWLHRPHVSKCIASKFVGPDQKEISIRSAPRPAKHSARSEQEYYTNLATARTGIALSGLGADTFRLWETMTMGTVAVVEKSMGLDKPLWRLPAVLVEDFDLVTPALLRSAYVEALYRAEEFEFQRLTQSFWWTFIANVSTAGGGARAQAVIDAQFPPDLSEDSAFARPKVPYQCGSNMEECGPGTKRTPRSTCGGKPPDAPEEDQSFVGNNLTL